MSSFRPIEGELTCNWMPGELLLPTMFNQDAVLDMPDHSVKHTVTGRVVDAMIMPNLCSQLYRGRDMDIAPHRTVARNAAIAAGMRCSQKVLSSEDYTLDQAISVAVREKWRVIVYAPRGKRGGVNYYLKGKDVSEEDATIEIMAHPRGQRSTRNGKCVFVLELQESKSVGLDRRRLARDHSSPVRLIISETVGINLRDCGFS